MDFEVRPLSPAMGAEIRGVDLSWPVDDALFASLYAAFLDHMVLVFPDQHLSEDDQIAFSRRFGTVHVNVRTKFLRAARPEIYVISNLDAEGRLMPAHPDPAAMVWHTDGSHQRERPIATMLYGRIVPSTGGDTRYANMYMAYDALDDDMKRQLEGARAVHSLEDSLRRSGQPIIAAEIAQMPPVEYDVVRVHPDTGRKCLYLGQHATAITGMPREQGEALVREINAHATRPEFQYHHRWAANDLVVWDNRCLLHQATPFDYANEGRLIHRTGIIGDRPPHLAGR